MPRTQSHAELQVYMRRQLDHRFRPAPQSGSLADLARRNDRSSALTPDPREWRAREQQDTMPRDEKHITVSNQAQAQATVGNRRRQLSEASELDSDSDEKVADEVKARSVAAENRSQRENALHEEELDHEDYDRQSDEDDEPESDHEDTMSNDDEAAIPSTEGITGRSWDIDRIGGTRELGSWVEYLVHWVPSRHASGQVKIQTEHNDEKFVLVENALWPVSRVTPDDGGMEQTAIEWVPTWHPIWELRCALKAIARYQREFPPVRSGAARVFDVRKTPTLSYRTFHDPEPEGRPGTVGDYMIHPQEGLDYTRSLLALLKQNLENGSVQITSSVATRLNMPARKQLTFRPEFVASDMTYRLNANNLLAATTYIAGYACETACDHCTSGAVLPFPKCVTWPNFNGGACVNCSLGKASVSCTHRYDVQWQLLARDDRLLLIDVEDEDDDDNDEGGEAPNELPQDHSVGDHDSDDPSDAVQRQVSDQVPVRRDHVPSTGNGLEVLDLSEDDPDDVLARLDARPAQAVPDQPVPAFSSSPADDSSSDSSPLPTCGMLESSPDRAGGLPSQQTSPSSFDVQSSSPDARNAHRKRRRGSEASVPPLRRRRRSGRSSNVANVQSSPAPARPIHAASRSAERPGSLGILYPDEPGADASLLEKVLAPPHGFTHPECGIWAPRCRHVFIDSGIKNEGIQSSSTVTIARFVPINRPNVQRRNSLSTLSKSSATTQLTYETVFSDQHFVTGELTKAQVRYILSRCHCCTTQLLHDAWEAAREEEPELGCKLTYLSSERVKEMNAVIGKVCPKPNPKGTKHDPIVL